MTRRAQRPASFPSRFLPALAAGLAAFWTCLPLAACSARQESGQRETDGTSARYRPLLTGADRVLVLPLRDGSCLPRYGNHVMCHLTGEHLEAGDVPPGTGIELGRLLHGSLRELGAAPVPYEESLALIAAANPIQVDRYDAELAVELGQKAEAGKVLMGVVSRYEERSGSWLGSREPAAVAFSLALVEVATGKVTYRTSFNRRQAPLTTNLFALPLWWREGFRWWDRHQVAAQAMREAAAGLVGAGGSKSLWTNMPAQAGPQPRGEWRSSPPALWQ